MARKILPVLGQPPDAVCGLCEDGVPLNPEGTAHRLAGNDQVDFGCTKLRAGGGSVAGVSSVLTGSVEDLTLLANRFEHRGLAAEAVALRAIQRVVAQFGHGRVELVRFVAEVDALAEVACVAALAPGYCPHPKDVEGRCQRCGIARQ